MLSLSIDKIIEFIREEKLFEAKAEDGSFQIKIQKYTPVIATAIHAGGQFRKELLEATVMSDHDRWYEEDPATKAMIATHPIVIAGCDSRFEYDLNRDPNNAVFETAWGKQLWHTPLSEEMKVT